jgi:hypothetical protein
MSTSAQDTFKIMVNGCTVEFQEYKNNIEIMAYMPDEGIDNYFFDMSESLYGTGDEVHIGSLELDRMPTFAEFEDHILRAVPEAARQRGVEPFQISDILNSEYEEVVLSVIGAGKWEAFTIRMSRKADRDSVRSMRAVIRELRQQLTVALSEK